MSRVHCLLIVGLFLGLLGAATATDLISLRAVAHAANMPLLSAVIIGTREAMPTSLAHVLEPLCAMVGMTVLLLMVPLPRPRRSALVFALGMLRSL
ncbi:MAG TPA: hypothetical protein VGQ62_05415 [Chloroflexota bacterium]|jgi:hypothetical protein|nr:hypothetical protein [Chloroflexota bacterium]